MSFNYELVTKVAGYNFTKTGSWVGNETTKIPPLGEITLPEIIIPSILLFEGVQYTVEYDVTLNVATPYYVDSDDCVVCQRWAIRFGVQNEYFYTLWIKGISP
jgi:hypothetical protein